MQSTDLQVLTNLAPVAKAQLEKAGFKVDMQSMDWQTLVARRVKKDPPDKGGWHAFLTSWVAADILNPVMAGFFNAVVRQGDVRLAVRREIEKLRDQFAKETDPAKQKADRRGSAEVLGRIIRRTSISASGTRRSRVRTTVDGNLTAPVTVFWNVSKK